MRTLTVNEHYLHSDVTFKALEHQFSVWSGF